MSSVEQHKYEFDPKQLGSNPFSSEHEDLHLQGGLSLSKADEEPGPEYQNVALLPMPQYDVELDTDHHPTVYTEKKRYGKLYVEEWQTSDGVKFDVGFFEPKRSRTDITMIEDTSWTTQVLGMNARGGMMAMRHGVKEVLKGPEINASIPLSQSAYNTHLVLDETDRRGFSQAKIAIVKGFSRGAMIALGTNAYGPAFGRELLFSDLTDMCLAKAVWEMTPAEFAECLIHLPQEARGTLKNLYRVFKNPALRHHYAKTVDLSINGVKQVIRTGTPLMNGEAGYMAERVPLDAKMHVRFIKGALPNHRKLFKRKLAGRKGVVFEDVVGSHIDGINDETRLNTDARLSGLVLQLSLGVKPQDIDWSLVHLVAEDEQAA